MGLSYTLLGSGSTGNTTLVSDGATHVLVDVGLSARETVRRLRECGLEPEQISAIVVSHEHGDHCRGVGPFAKKLNTPVFIADGALNSSGMVVDERKLQRIVSGDCFEVRGIQFTSFSVPHDAADPLAFVIEKDGIKIGIVLDLGTITNLIRERLKSCDGIVIESNHDLQMLKLGPYPWALKQRVMSRSGHLSNDSVAEYLENDFDGSAKHVVLAHLSQKNNLPEIALLSAQRALESRSSLSINQTKLELALADRISKTYRY
jgi:phosphoribosyl 1,2-cyclic phosphodiesterase